MWNEIIKNELWEYDNFLHEETVEHIKHQMFQSGSTELEPGEAILPNFRNSGVNATTYNYTIHRTDIHKNKEMINLYMDKIKAVENDGILINDEAMIGGSLLFPDKGQFRENDQFDVNVTNFSVTESQENLPGLNKFKKSMVHINLELTLKNNVTQTGADNIEQINFTRGIFLSNNYIGSLN